MAGLPVVECCVEGVNYQVTLLDAVSARQLYLRLLKSIAPGLAGLASLSDKSSEIALLSAFADIVAGLDVKLFDDLCNAMAASTRIQNPDGSTTVLGAVFGIYFAGKYNHLIQWLVACLNANKFLDFLPGGLLNGNPGM